jgi:hypothetical protein
LALLSQQNRTIPDLVQLGTICILMAAKLEEPISPSFNRMINLLKGEQKSLVSKEALVELEMDIVISLDNNLMFETVVPFIERFIIIAAIEGEVIEQVKYAAF